MTNNKISIEDLRRFKFVSDPQVSPDGEKIAFVLSKINYEEDAYERHIWMIDRASGEMTQFTYGPGRDNYPRWSPDGRWLLFISSGRHPGKKAQLMAIPIDGGEARQLADMEKNVMAPEWAPDSRRVLFLSRIWTVEKPKTDVKVIRRLKYKMKGAGIIENTRRHLFTTSLDGGEPEQLTRGEFDVDAAKWSPDGEEIAFVAWMGKVTSYNRFRDVYSIPSTGGEANKLTPGRHVITDLFWSPDGKDLALLGHDLRFRANNVDIWLLPATGGTPRNITASHDRTHRNIGGDVRVGTPWPGAVWSPDGGSIYFMTGGLPTTNIYRIDVGTEKIDQLTSGINIEGFSLSADHSVMAYSAMNATNLADIWLRDGEGERRLTRVNKGLWEELSLSVPEPYTWVNELGDEIVGWIIKPQDFEQGKKYPAILQIHGGLRAMYGDVMYHEFQVLASEGYVVLYTNPRGSDGYGEDYAHSVFGHCGDVDYEDLMRFMDDALERYDFIDPDRLGVTGGSYGGYLTNIIVTKTGRFSAAVTCRSVTNWYSLHGTSDNQFRGFALEDSTIAYPWRDTDAVLRISPVHLIKNPTTPTMIIHSEKDFRIPIEQAEEFYIALKECDVETEFVRFPDEGHELSRSGKPRHREERLQHIVRWFNKYLK